MFFSCSSAPQARSGRDASPALMQAKGQPDTEAAELYGPAGSPDSSPDPLYGPEPARLKPVTLVLGPGQARAFAEAGVLRALVENNVPIAAIYGMEMGGLMGALYASEASINHFEWSLLHFKSEALAPTPTMLSRFFNKGGDTAPLEEELQEAFGAHDLSGTKIPMRIAIQKSGDLSATVLEKGKLTDVLRVALAIPGVFKAGSWQGQSSMAAESGATEKQLCDEARARYGSPVVLIETAGSGVDPSSADLVIRPPLSGIGPTDFDRRTEIAFRGKTALLQYMPDIRRFVGMPPPDSGQTHRSIPHKEGTSP